ncbi:hypothetical protein C0J52_00665 [Blattella germanica]|nr:hypothetical protein C0J52_00665 [Blattella germanica]PSN56864.1 hypothetical protein C0J52_00665 [Blattella germanica]
MNKWTGLALFLCLIIFAVMVGADSQCPPVEPGTEGLCDEECEGCTGICCPNGCGHYCYHPFK